MAALELANNLLDDATIGDVVSLIGKNEHVEASGEEEDHDESPPPSKSLADRPSNHLCGFMGTVMKPHTTNTTAGARETMEASSANFTTTSVPISFMSVTSTTYVGPESFRVGTS